MSRLWSARAGTPHSTLSGPCCGRLASSLQVLLLRTRWDSRPLEAMERDLLREQGGK